MHARAHTHSYILVAGTFGLDFGLLDWFQELCCNCVLPQSRFSQSHDYVLWHVFMWLGCNLFANVLLSDVFYLLSLLFDYLFTVYCFLAVPEVAKSQFVSVVPGQGTENKISVKGNPA